MRPIYSSLFNQIQTFCNDLSTVLKAHNEDDAVKYLRPEMPELYFNKPMSTQEKARFIAKIMLATFLGMGSVALYVFTTTNYKDPVLTLTNHTKFSIYDLEINGINAFGTIADNFMIDIYFILEGFKYIYNHFQKSKAERDKIWFKSIVLLAILCSIPSTIISIGSVHKITPFNLIFNLFSGVVLSFINLAGVNGMLDQIANLNQTILENYAILKMGITKKYYGINHIFKSNRNYFIDQVWSQHQRNVKNAKENKKLTSDIENPDDETKELIQNNIAQQFPAANKPPIGAGERALVLTIFWLLLVGSVISILGFLYDSFSTPLGMIEKLKTKNLIGYYSLYSVIVATMFVSLLPYTYLLLAFSIIPAIKIAQQIFFLTRHGQFNLSPEFLHYPFTTSVSVAIKLGQSFFSDGTSQALNLAHFPKFGIEIYWPTKLCTLLFNGYLSSLVLLDALCFFFLRYGTDAFRESYNLSKILTGYFGGMTMNLEQLILFKNDINTKVQESEQEKPEAAKILTQFKKIFFANTDDVVTPTKQPTSINSEIETNQPGFFAKLFCCEWKKQQPLLTSQTFQYGTTSQ